MNIPTIIMNNNEYDEYLFKKYVVKNKKWEEEELNKNKKNEQEEKMFQEEQDKLCEKILKREMDRLNEKYITQKKEITHIVMLCRKWGDLCEDFYIEH